MYFPPFGYLQLLKKDTSLERVVFTKSCKESSPNVYDEELELTEYLLGKRSVFTSTFTFSKGTRFQKKVWSELLNIPYGTTITYSELATRCGNPKAIRAVGTALGKNPIPIFIPCHRVIGKKGLGGFAWGLDIKKYLLEREGISFS